MQDPAMISETLGYSLDIFCGGIDNLYRHHDYNIAVMESVSGEELARYWLHGQHVLVGGKKMSKSLHNIVYPEDLVDQGFSWEQIRFYLLSRHYRKRINLNMDRARKARSKLEALREMDADLLPGSGVEKTINDKAVSEPDRGAQGFIRDGDEQRSRHAVCSQTGCSGQFSASIPSTKPAE